jgi:hypothetical protein
MKFQNNSIWKYFHDSFFVTFVFLVLSYLIGGFQALLATCVLAILETSFSFDNAVVNSTVLRNMTPKWRHRFITWGMLIAVFGMRFIFPLGIVSIISGIAPVQNPLYLIGQGLNSYFGAGIDLIGAFAPVKNALGVALFAPKEYAEILSSSHTEIVAFGGAFLSMVFWKYFIDEEKDVHWIKWIEEPMTKLAKVSEMVQVALTMISLLIVSHFVNGDTSSFFAAGLSGILVFIITEGFESLVESKEDGPGVSNVAKAGLASFIYLEVLDASFSFDGVIGAFAITDEVFIIALGLGIGAMFVRSLTLMMVDHNTLQKFVYLENSAFWAIGLLTVLMFVGVFIEIPEYVTGLSSALIIIAGVIHSVIKNKQEAKTSDCLATLTDKV